jgi:hypothetical protein
VQNCVVHVIRNAMRFESYKDRKKVASCMHAIYSAPYRGPPRLHPLPNIILQVLKPLRGALRACPRR